MIPCRSWLLAALHTPGEPWSRLAPFLGWYHGCEAGPKSPILEHSTLRSTTSSPRWGRHVERAVFGAAELPKPALIPCFTWLQAALHTLGKPWSCLASLQGWYHGCEAGPKSPISPLFQHQVTLGMREASSHASYGAPTLAHRAPPARSLGCHGLLHLAAQTVLVQRAALGTRRLPRPPACSKLGAR